MAWLLLLWVSFYSKWNRLLLWGIIRLYSSNSSLAFLWVIANFFFPTAILKAISRSPAFVPQTTDSGFSSSLTVKATVLCRWLISSDHWIDISRMGFKRQFPAALRTSSILSTDGGYRGHTHLIIISLRAIPSNSVWVGKYWKYYNVLSASAEIIYLKSGCSVEPVFICWIIHSEVILSPWQVSTTPLQVSLRSHLGTVQNVVSGFSVKMGLRWTRNEPRALCQLNNVLHRPIYAYRSLDAVRLLIASTCRAAQQHQLCTCIILDQSAIDYERSSWNLLTFSTFWSLV